MLTRDRFKQALVAFWAVWWAIAFLTDFIGGLNELGLTSTRWFAGENYPFLRKTLAPYGIPTALATLLFVGIIAWSFLSTILFTIAAITPIRQRARWLRRVDTAFIASLGFWLAFFLSDQIFLKFNLEQNHMVQGGFQLLCYLAIHLLPADTPSRAEDPGNSA